MTNTNRLPRFFGSRTGISKTATQEHFFLNTFPALCAAGYQFSLVTGWQNFSRAWQSQLGARLVHSVLWASWLVKCDKYDFANCDSRLKDQFTGFRKFPFLRDLQNLSFFFYYLIKRGFMDSLCFCGAIHASSFENYTRGKVFGSKKYTMYISTWTCRATHKPRRGVSKLDVCLGKKKISTGKNFHFRRIFPKRKRCKQFKLLVTPLYFKYKLV